MIVVVGALGFVREADEGKASIDFLRQEFKIQKEASTIQGINLNKSIESVVAALNLAQKDAGDSRDKILINLSIIDGKVDIQEQKLAVLQSIMDAATVRFSALKYRVTFLEKEVGRLEKITAVVETKILRTEEEVKELNNIHSGKLK